MVFKTKVLHLFMMKDYLKIKGVSLNKMSSIPGAFASSTCRYADIECEHRKDIIPELPKKRADIEKQIHIEELFYQ